MEYQGRGIEILTLTLILFYLDFGLLTTGFSIAYFRDLYPELNSKEDRRDDAIFGYLMGLTGPIGLIGFLACRFSDSPRPRLRLQYW